MIEANNPQFRSWINVDKNSDFPIQNIPFGIAKINGQKSVVTRIGDTVICLSTLYDFHMFDCVISENFFNSDISNDFIEI